MPKWLLGDIPNELLKYERKKREWTQKDVADRIGEGVDARLVRKWEGGTVAPGPHNRQKLVEVFGKKTARALGFPLEGEIPFWHVPYRRNDFFTGREDIIQQLHDTFLAQRAGSAPLVPLALSGLGGVGKSQIALEYAYRCRAQYYYHTVLWMQVISSQQLDEDFIVIANLMDLPEKDTNDSNVRIDAVKTWLKQLTRWLLILDNVDNFQLLERFLPDEIKGNVLLTTRSQSSGPFTSRSMLVQPLDDYAGAELLLHRAKILPLERTLEQASPADAADARSHSKNIGGLPLALDQAGAYIEEADMPLADYIERYQKMRRDLLNRRGRDLSLSQHPESVVTTLELGFANARKRHPPAGDLLDFCAFLQPDTIPEEVLLRATNPNLDTLSLDSAVIALLAYSLIRRNAQEKTFSMHRLVQDVLIDNLSSHRRRQWREHVVHALNSVFPEVEFKNWTQCGRLLGHALVCRAWIEDELAPIYEASKLFHKAGIYLRDRGQYSDGLLFLERVLTVREQCVGPEHRDTATICHDLAGLYWLMGKYDWAEALAKRALVIRKQCLGPNHPDTARTLNGLAALYDTQGKYDQAEPLYLRGLAIRQQCHGDDHPDTARSLNDLGILYLV